MASKWYYYPEQNPSLIHEFNEQESLTITQKFDTILKGTSKADKITLQNGTVIDFTTLQCTLPGKGDVFKVSVNFSGEFVPYVVTMGGPEAGVSPDDKVLLNSIPQSFIGHKWLWWWNRSGKDPFIDEYERLEYAVRTPQWKLYTDEDSKHIEQGYQTYLRDKTRSSCPINGMFSVGFNKTYKTQHTKSAHSIMIQYRTNSPSAYRPAIRAVYAWFWNKSDDYNSPAWEPYPLEISELLESALLSRKTEVALPKVAGLTQQQNTYVVNFLDMTQCRSDARFFKRDVRRAGTAISESHSSQILLSTLSNREAIPSYWATMTELHGTFNVPLDTAEGAAIASMMNKKLTPLPYYGTVAGIYDQSTGFQLPAAYFEVVGIHRIQDKKLWSDYVPSKLLLTSKYGDNKVSAMPSTKELLSMRLTQYACDRRSNEYYFWYGCDRAVANQIIFGTTPEGARLAALPGQGPVFLADLSCKANLDIDCPVCKKGSPTTNLACSCRERNISSPYVMFMCRVILGNCFHYVSGKPIPGMSDPSQLMTNCPIDPVTKKPYDSVIADSPALGSKEKFRTIVIYNRTQVYPEYAVYYYRGEYDPNR